MKGKITIEFDFNFNEEKQEPLKDTEAGLIYLLEQFKKHGKINNYDFDSIRVSLQGVK